MQMTRIQIVVCERDASWISGSSNENALEWKSLGRKSEEWPAFQWSRPNVQMAASVWSLVTTVRPFEPSEQSVSV